MLCSGIGPSRRDCFHLPEPITPLPILVVRMAPSIGPFHGIFNTVSSKSHKGDSGGPE
jgi:hypothetical protein